MLPDSYSCALIDASIFRYAFSDELKARLSGMQVYVSQTFETEVNQFGNNKFLLGDASRILEENLRFLGQMPQKMKIIQASGPAHRLNGDTWGAITFLAEQGNTKHIVLISANYLLWQQLVLSDMPIDSYDPITDRLYPVGSYKGMRERVDLHYEPRRLRAPAQVAGEGTTLFRKNGGPVTLGAKQHEGAEAILYWAGAQKTRMAKIFWPDKLPYAKFQNIEQFAGNVNRLGISWAEFSWDILYYDRGCTVPAGILEKYIPTKATLGSDALYLGDFKTAFRKGMDRRTIADTIRLCLQIVCQVAFLNQYGFFISDYNWDNFSTYEDNFTGNIQMWDTDSFGFGNYFSGMFANNIIPTRQYHMNSKLDVFAFCNESLCSFVFSVFSLGDAPVCEQDGLRFFKYQGPDSMQGNVKQNFFPSGLLRYFNDVYNGRVEPSPAMLMVILKQALKTPFANNTWREVLKQNLQLSEEEIVNYTKAPDQDPLILPPQNLAQKQVEKYQKENRKKGQETKAQSQAGGNSQRDEKIYLALVCLLLVGAAVVVLMLVCHKLGILCSVHPLRFCASQCRSVILSILQRIGGRIL